MSTLPAISPELIKAYQDEIARNTSESTAKRKAASLNKFFGWAKGEGKISKNPMAQEKISGSEYQVTNTTQSHKAKVGKRVWITLATTSALVILLFLLTFKLKFPIPFTLNFAQENTNPSVPSQYQTQISQQTPITATSAGNPAWNLYAQLKLADASGNPQVGSETVTFKLYNTDKDGTPVYTSDPQTITTDANGSALISLDKVPSDVFFQNNKLFLEPEVGSASGNLRIPVSTANIAANLGGFFPANPEAGAGPLTVPVISANGSLNLASQSPAIIGKQGNLLIQGQAVTIKSADGGNGNIEINPDGKGYAHFLFEGSKGNFLNAQGPNLTSGSLFYGMVPNNATGYDLIKLQSGAPKMTTRFSVDALGYASASGSINTAGDLQTSGVSRVSSTGVLENITGYSQNSGNFVINQNPGDYASVTKSNPTAALTDVLNLTLDENNKPGSHYASLVINRLGGDPNARALLVNSGNSEFKGQVELGRFDTNPTLSNTIGPGSLVYNNTDNTVYFWNGTTWVSMGPSGGGTAFNAITSGTNTTATMVVGSGASLDYSGTGTINASTLNSLADTSFLRSDTSSNLTSGTLTTNAGTTLAVNGDLTVADPNVAFTGASTTFTTTGDLNLNIGGGNLTLANNQTINIGGNGSHVAYNVIADSIAGAGPGMTSDKDLYVQGNLQVGGSINGLSITPGGFTTGSVTFIGPSGNLSEDNANFFWDNTAKKLVLGGDLAVNGGNLTTTQTTANVFTNASTLGIGAGSGTTTVNNNLAITGPTGITANGNGAGIQFNGIGNHTIQVTAGVLQLGAVTLTGPVTGNNQNITGVGDLSVNGNTTLGASTANTVTYNARVNSNIVPSVTDTYNLGSASPALEWNNVYAKSFVQNGQLVCDAAGNNCPTGAGIWAQNLGAVYPINNTVDLLIGATAGSTATQSAKFAFTGVNTGLPTASIAGDIANVATYLTGDGNLATTNARDLTLGSSSTGNVVINSRGLTALTANNANLTASGTVTLPNSNTLTGVANYLQNSQGFSVGGGTTYYFDGLGNINANAGTFASNVAVNGGNLTTTQTTANLFTNASTLGIGAGTGTTTINNALAVTGNTNLNGNTTLGDATGDNITFTGRVNSNIVPSVTDTDNLGSASPALEWNNVYAKSFVQNGFGVCDSNGTNCPSGAGFWGETLGAIYPSNNTVDLLIGATAGPTATTSAKFAFTGVNSGVPTATILGTTPGVTTYLTGNGNLAVTNNADLTLGGATTANVIANSPFTAGSITDTGLTASRTVFTDANKTLTTTGTVAANQGGTGFSTYTVGDILYADTTSTLAKLADAATGNVLLSQGAGVAPSYGKVVLGTHTTGNYVSSIIGTANEITASSPTGDVTLTIPLDFRAPGTVNAVNGIYTGAIAGIQRIDASGDLTNIAQTQLNGVNYTWPGSATANYILQSLGSGTSSTLTWVDPASVTASTQYWDQSSGGTTGGALYPKNNTVDLLIGASSTASAKFAFTNILAGTPTLNVSAQATNIAIKDNTTSALQILEGTTNPYLAINTNNGTENMAFGNATTNPSYTFLGSGLTTLGGNLAVNGAASADITTTTNTATLFNTNAATLNIGSAATSITFGIPGASGSMDLMGGSGNTGCTLNGVNGNLTCTGNITTTATSGTQGWWQLNGSDLAPSSTSYNLAVGGTTSASPFYVVASTGNVTTSGNVAINGGSLTSTAGTFNLLNGNTAQIINFGSGTGGNTIGIGNGINTSAQTVSIANGAAASDSTVNILSGNSTSGTQTLNLGNGNRATAINLGSGTGGNTINIAGTGATGADTINIGTSTTAADTIAIGNNNVSTTLALTGGTAWNVSTTGLITTASNIAVNGGSLTTTNATANIFTANAATINLGINGSGVINTGGGSAANGCTFNDANGNLTCAGNITSTSTSGSQGFWGQTSGGTTGGVLYPLNNTVDLLIGANSTASAKFAFTGVNTGGTPTASIAGTTANVATFIDGNGNISTTNRANLTLGNSATYNSTGNILLNPNGTGLIGIGTTTLSTEFNVLGSGQFSGIAAPGALTATVTGTAGNVDVGTHSYEVTFVDASGETAGGTISNHINVTSSAKQVNLTAIPLGTNGVTARRIYRTVAGDTGNYKLLTTISDNSTTIYTDNTADASLGTIVVPTVNATGGIAVNGYSRFGTATTTHNLGSSSESSTGDVLISGNQELDGTLYLDGGTIADSRGVATILFATDPTLVNSPNVLDDGVWWVNNTVNDGMAALMINQSKGGDIFTASASGVAKLTLTNAGNLGIGITNPNSTLSLLTVSAPGSAPTGTGAITGGSISSGTYFYEVTAVGADGESLPSSESSGIVIASGSTGSIQLSWPAVTGAIKYRVYRTTSSGTYGASSFVGTGLCRSPRSNACFDSAAATSTGTPPTIGNASLVAINSSGNISSQGTLDIGNILASDITFPFGNRLTGFTGFNNYFNASGGIGTGGQDSILNAQRITSAGNLVNIGSIQAGDTLLTSGGTFATKVDYGTGTLPFVVAIGDINGDGKADIVVGNTSSNTISVLINNGSGTFATKVDYGTASLPEGIAIGDINGDGKADIVVANNGNVVVSVFINNGNGTFATKVDYTVGSNPIGVALADVNGDGKLDIVSANTNDNTVSVLINNGNGTFATKVDYGTGTLPTGVAFGDVNGDGKADIVVANNTASTVSVLMNNGNGTFATKVDYGTGTLPEGVSLGDVNGDGKLDIVTGNTSAATVSVLINNGNGTFATKVDYGTGSVPYFPALGDVNGDGKPDIVVANSSDNTVSVLINNGNGTFATKVDYGTGSIPTGTALGDLNGDGKSDIVVTDEIDNKVSVLMNNKTTLFYAQASTGNVGIGNLSPNAKLDVAGAASISGTLTVGNGTINTIQSPFGPLNLAYKSGPNTWTTGITLKDITGNVGIGTTGPLSTLSVGGVGLAGAGVYGTNTNWGLYGLCTASNCSGVTGDSGSGATAAGLVGLNSSTGYGVYGNNTAGVGIGGYFTSTAGYALITGTGNVGIGTNTPTAKLDVLSGQTATGVRLLSGSSTSFTAYSLGRASIDANLGVTGQAGNWFSGSSVGDVALMTNQQNLAFSTSGGNNSSIFILANGVSAGLVGINNITPQTTLDVGGSISGNSVNTSRADTVAATTVTVTGRGVAYFVVENSGTANLDVDDTFNITGIPENDGTFAFIFSRAQKGVTANLHSTTTNVQINGIAISSVSTPSQLAANAIVKSYTVVHMNGTWRVIGGLGNFNTLPADLAEWIRFTGATPISGQLLSIDSNTGNVKAATSDSTLAGIVTTAPFQTMGQQTDSSTQMALAGRVPTIVSNAGGVIKSGDAITASDIPGVGKKLNFGGFSVGKALDTTANWSSQTCPAVNSVDDITWPNDDGQNTNKPCFTLPDGTRIGKIMVLLGVSWEEPQTALTDEGNLNIEQVQDTNGNPTGKYALSMNLGQGLKETTTRISTFADVIVANIKAGAITTTDFVAENVKAGSVIATNFTTNNFTAFQGTIDHLLVTTGLVTPNINVALISPLPNTTDVTVQIGSEATPSGKLAIDNAQGNEVASIDNEGNASFSGVVHSQNIDAIQQLLTSVSADQSTLADIISSGSFSATNSANLSQIATQNLYVTNQAAINSLSLAQSLTLGSDFTLDANGINSLTTPLKLESLATAPIELMAGLVTIDTHGNVTIAGDLNVAGNIKANSYQLSAVNPNGSPLAQIDASGSAIFNSVTTPSIIIGAADATESAVVANGAIDTNSTVGKVIIPAGVSEITINNPKVTDYTLVYVTPTSSTQNNVLYVKSKQNGSFVVGFDNPVNVDVNFNWWIVQVQ